MEREGDIDKRKIGREIDKNKRGRDRRKREREREIFEREGEIREREISSMHTHGHINVLTSKDLPIK